MSKENMDSDKTSFKKTGIVLFIGFISIIIFLNLARDYFPWRYYSIYISHTDNGLFKSGDKLIFQGKQVGYIKENIPNRNKVITHSKFKRKLRLPNEIGIRKKEKNNFHLKIINTNAPFWNEGDTISIELLK